MKLINAGLARTGTTSLKTALEILGYAPVHHTFDLFSSPKDMTLWEGAFEGQAVDWHAYYAEYKVADWPAALFYQEIIDAHPKAKVLLTVRDPERWFESISSTVKQGMNIKLPIPHIKRVQKFISTYPAQTLFDGRMDDKAHMIRCFERHVAAVREYVPAHRLLVYDVCEGWEPLCTFLNAAVPERPFPRTNTRGGFLGKVMQVVGKS